MVLLLSAASPAGAKTFMVTNTHEDGSGSFVAALSKANQTQAPDTIRITAHGTVDAGGGYSAFQADTTVIGPGPSKFTLRGSDSGGSLLGTASDIEVKISGITIRHGRADPSWNSGAGFFASLGSKVKFDRVHILDNKVDAPGVAFGGGIHNQGQMTIHRSVISGNSAIGADGAEGGGVFSLDTASLRIVDSTISGNRSTSPMSGGGGGVLSSGPLTVTGSTISRNHADFGGGAFTTGVSHFVNDTVAENEASHEGGGIEAGETTTSLNGVTLVRNAADADDSGGELGGGLMQLDPGSVSVKNSILALNTITGGVNEQDCDGSFESNSHNLLTNDFQCFGFTGGDVFTAHPKLGKLKHNGGFAQTVGLLRGSPAINGADTDAPKRDQRGVERGKHPDIGAFERN
jgi:hypothetical protein